MGGSQVGIPLFYLQELAGARLQFKDLFNDDDVFWGWRKNGAAAGRTIIETSGLMNLAVTAVDGRWDTTANQAPKIIISPNGMPCEITTKLAAGTFGLDTQAGLIWSKGPTSFGSNVWQGIVRRNRGGGSPFNGIAVVNSNDVVAWTGGDTTLPVWFKLRLNCIGYRSLTVRFYYSYDGVNFTVANEDTESEYSATLGGICLAAMNNIASTAGNSGVSAGFDHFIMRPKTIN